MKKKALILLIILALCASLAPAAHAGAEPAAQVVETGSGTYSFAAGEEFEYYFWFRLAPDYINYTTDYVSKSIKGSEDSALFSTLLNSPTLLKQMSLDNITGRVYYDDSVLSLVKAEMPNLKSGVAGDFSAIARLAAGLDLDTGRTGAAFFNHIFSDEEAQEYNTDTLQLVKCTFRVDHPSEEPTQIRTRLRTVKVNFEQSGKKKNLHLVQSGKAYYPYESYDTVNDEKPTIMLKALVDDVSFNVFHVESEDDKIPLPVGAGAVVTLTGADTNVSYSRYTALTNRLGAATFYDVPYGTYYAIGGYTDENGAKYFTDGVSSSDGTTIPSASFVNSLTLLRENGEEMRDIDVEVVWAGDDGYLPVRPAALNVSVYDANKPNDALETVIMSSKDTELNFYAVEVNDMHGEPIDYVFKAEPAIAGTSVPYTFDFAKKEGQNEKGNDVYVLTCTYTGSAEELNVITPDEHGHYWKAIQEDGTATCDKSGYAYFKCLDCQLTKYEEIGPLGHNFVDYKYNNDAACEKSGTMTAKCTRCSATDTKDDPSHPALEHKFSTWVRAGDATCTDAGHDKRSCTRPGCTKTETRDSEFGPLGHVWSEWEWEIEPTCEKDGTVTRHCTRKGCTANESKTDTGSALGHEYGKWQIITPATCTTDAVREHQCIHKGCTKTEQEPVKGSKLGHNWGEWDVETPATCETNAFEKRSCKRCTEFEIEEIPDSALGHLMGDYVYNNDAACEKNGTVTAKCTRSNCTKEHSMEIDGTALGHQWGAWVSDNNATDEADGTKTRTCTRPGCTGSETVTDVGSATCHHYGEYVSDNNATCASCGTKTAVCTDPECESTHTVDDPEGQPATGHSWSEWTGCGDATCTFSGTQERHCENEGCTASEKRVDPDRAPGHSWGAWVADGNATCTQDGTHTRTCTVEGCGVTQTEINKGGALGHDFGDYVYNNDATCEKDGTESKTCQRDNCGFVVTRTAANTKRSHNWSAYTPDGNATCTSNGTKSRVCQYEDCNEKQTVPATTGKLGHNWSNYVYNNDATCTEDGTETRVCKREGCGYEETRTKPGTKLGHSWSAFVYNNDATCQRDGTKTRTCQREGCGKTETIAATGTKKGHNYVDGYCTMCHQPDTQTVKYTLTMSASQLHGGNEVYIDGVRYIADAAGKVILDTATAKTAVVYTYNTNDMSDLHTVYPTHMYVYTLNLTSRTYTAVARSGLTDILQYAGSSIRIKGVKGIRMITSIPSATRDRLINSNVDGFTLQEYGTILAWDSDLNGASLTRGHPSAKGNYAYSRAMGKDPIFARSSNLIQYTNVITNLSNDKCVKDLSMRTYMVLTDASGNEITIYGGTVHRSIGYIAYQNRNAFDVGSDAYEYVWDIIHYVYGNVYDNEYRG